MVNALAWNSARDTSPHPAEAYSSNNDNQEITHNAQPNVTAPTHVSAFIGVREGQALPEEAIAASSFLQRVEE